MKEITKSVELLKSWCLNSGIPWNDEASTRFERYIKSILEYQKLTNLTGFSSSRDLVEQMIMDSLRILRVLEPMGPLVDVGTGAGFPGIPLKIIHPEIEMHLVEPRTKRYAFLRKVARDLGFSNLYIHNNRIEQLDLACVKTAISKAFARPDAWIELCSPWIARDNAQIACYFSAADYQTLVEPILANDITWSENKFVESDRVYLVLRKNV